MTTDRSPGLIHALDVQIEILLRKGYPDAAGLSEQDFLEHVEPLRDILPAVPARAGADVPFVLVVSGVLVPPLKAVARLELRGKTGFTTMPADDVARFRPVAGLDVPAGPAYLLVDPDTGGDTLGVAPQDALPGLLTAGRTPLTLEEGLALVTQQPELLVSANCFEMLGSRGTNKRVTGLWVMKGGAPRLGWCWMGAPHSWLGAASAAGRVGQWTG